MKNTLNILSVLIFALMVSPLWAGEIVEITEKDLKNQNAAESTMQFLFADKFMKMTGQDDTDMIFNNETKTMLIISHADKSYMTFDQNTVSDVQSSIQSAMEQALANVPPEQRAMVEEMMKSRMGGMGGMPNTGAPAPVEITMPKIEFRETSRSDTVSGYDCTYYESFENDQKDGEHCIATWSELGVGDNIQNSFTAMAEMMEGFLEQVSQMSGAKTENNMLTYLKDMEGYPVLSRQFSNGEAVRESRLSSIAEKDFDDSEFMPPSGYNEQSLMGN